MKNWIYLTMSFLSLACQNAPKDDAVVHTTSPAKNKISPSTATLPMGKAIPILCYHQIRSYRVTDSKTAKDYIVPPEIFKDQIKALADSGYHTVTPDQLYEFLTKKGILPPKPIMITFDDTDLDQFTVGAPVLSQYQYKGVFFIMTVAIGKPHYMSREQIRELSDAGHVIGAHSWDHHPVKKYVEEDWVTQVDKPTKLLEDITGKKIQYFAYPFGLWNEEAIPQLKERGFKAAFQLYGKHSQIDSLFTIKRIIVTGDMKVGGLFKRIHQAF